MSGGVQTLDRALAILKLFQSDRPEWGAAEVAREMGLTLPTTSRVMRALEVNGLLMRVEGRRFRLGFGAIELGFRALESIELRERLRAPLIHLARETGETAVLGVVTEARDAARVVDRVEGREMIRISLDIGHTWPLHAGALAKVLLAYMPDRAAILEQPLEKIGRNTITDPAQLHEELERIRRRDGWAESAQETEGDAWGIAQAVVDDHEQPLAAILLIAPLARRTSRHAARLRAALQEALPDARHRLGLSPGPTGVTLESSC
ncbi:IclR family transcriptional regulator [Capillimicrobium parvum]|uniref:Transcriptional repressor IclR n=1 Tax=Capillimicrobium parvum TaxID=2884022 RepID=A0A9E6Y2K7_9ACTN|nr:IclR family transcriptional regulator [Capillimicrobium parvum]UGS38317.1 Transcriptional repressor IclR [Capillimicrobium parvum]